MLDGNLIMDDGMELPIVPESQKMSKEQILEFIAETYDVSNAQPVQEKTDSQGLSVLEIRIDNFDPANPDRYVLFEYTRTNRMEGSDLKSGPTTIMKTVMDKNGYVAWPENVIELV